MAEITNNETCVIQSRKIGDAALLVTTNAISREVKV